MAGSSGGLPSDHVRMEAKALLARRAGWREAEIAATEGGGRHERTSQRAGGVAPSPPAKPGGAELKTARAGRAGCGIGRSPASLRGRFNDVRTWAACLLCPRPGQPAAVARRPSDLDRSSPAASGTPSTAGGRDDSAWGDVLRIPSHICWTETIANAFGSMPTFGSEILDRAVLVGSHPYLCQSPRGMGCFTANRSGPCPSCVRSCTALYTGAGGA